MIDCSKTIKIVQKWSDEHTVKTIKDDFLEKFPNAELKPENGTPNLCAMRLGYPIEDAFCSTTPCEQCWNQPLEDK